MTESVWMKRSAEKRSILSSRPALRGELGLGLSLMAQAAQEAGGMLRIESELGKGTKVTATFQYHHIDRKPLGNMVETMTTLLLGNPELNISYIHQKEGKSYVLNSQVAEGAV